MQTEEALKTRIDGRAPRVAVRKAVVEEPPLVAVGSEGSQMRRITEADLDLDSSRSLTRQLIVTSRVTLANEGSQTARIILPRAALIARESERTMILPPGTEGEVQLRVVAMLGEWARASEAKVPVSVDAEIVIDDSFVDGVQDVIVVGTAAYAVAPTDSPGKVSVDREFREALGLLSSVEVSPVRRRYLMLTESPEA